ncbi:MAG TPA: hypothetical protein DDW18_04530, partial [Firmicutes bacterium]|nr:hypothetical protein [Bacillota bacterium]
MKKNEAMGWLVYILMLAIAGVVGFAILRPELSSATLPMNSILFVVIAVAAGILLSSNLLELGHIIGAKIGGYKINKVNILGMQFQRKEDGKFHFSFSFSFDGLTGETVICPKNPEKSNPRHYIYAPLFFLLLEVAASAAFMSLGLALKGNEPMWGSSYIFALVVLVIVILVNLYNIFPAALDSKNDGYLMIILNNKTNVLAYNNLLLAQEKMMLGQELPETPIYKDVTDFTNSLNQIAIYKALDKKDFAKALEINEYAISCKENVSSRVYESAVAQKLSIHLLNGNFEEAKEEYINLPLEDKKFIANLSCAPAVRAYLLVSGLIDESETEARDALAHADKAIKDSGEEKKHIELELIGESLAKVKNAHPEW